MTNSDLYLRFATQETQKQTSAKTYMLTVLKLLPSTGDGSRRSTHAAV